ncbi:zinc metalloprotease HtpX [Azospirillum picis]|uniref:Heat shock protein HtpX n=1 Tax=Azospirillum picis TaxID=488438 RepID=A0ABU0MHX1_9PROT|nr:zinc metalloprotease HtpX [Azospirillum picis]MBP2298942.1 heat shock protein HtpX [Azospirillum picis]MDQ0532816.1 heat shock protein HtpX [Azospirillum picis]
MLRPDFRHRLVNHIQSLLLIAGMAAIAWLCISAVAGGMLTLLVVAGAILGLLLAPGMPKRVLLSAYHAQRLRGAEFPEGAALLAELAQRAGLPQRPELYYIPSSMPNAFAVGDPEDSAVCVTDGLLRLLDRREFAGVLAHEVAHIAARDLWIMAVADVMSRVVSLASWVGQLILLLNVPLLLAGAAVVPWHVPLLLIFSPTLMSLLQLALSRTREFDADRNAVRLTGDAGGLASALMKLERRTGRFWEDIFLPGRRIPEPSLLRTHPPTEARVARLRDLAGASTPPRRPARPLDIHRPAVLRRPGYGRYGVYR